MNSDYEVVVTTNQYSTIESLSYDIQNILDNNDPLNDFRTGDLTEVNPELGIEHIFLMRLQDLTQDYSTYGNLSGPNGQFIIEAKNVNGQTSFTDITKGEFFELDTRGGPAPQIITPNAQQHPNPD